MFHLPIADSNTCPDPEPNSYASADKYSSAACSNSNSYSDTGIKHSDPNANTSSDCYTYSESDCNSAADCNTAS